MFPSFFSLRVLDVRPSAKQLQQLVTGLELTADRGSAWGQLVSGTTIPLPPPDTFQPSTNLTLCSLSRNLRGPKSSVRDALGVKGVQADGQVLACRMLTIRQKTLIGFNWKSIMGLIANSPCCYPRMAPVIWGLT